MAYIDGLLLATALATFRLTLTISLFVCYPGLYNKSDFHWGSEFRLAMTD